MRLGLFIDGAYRAAGGRVWSGSELLGFTRFAAAVGESFEELTLIARATADAEATPFELPENVGLHPLPNYPSLRQIGRVIMAVPGTLRGFWRSLDRVDLVWVSLGSPMALAALVIARMRRRPAVLLVRQDTMAYFRSRLPSRAWTPILAPLWLIDRAVRLVGRRCRVTAVGDPVARSFGPSARVLAFQVNLIRAAQLVESDSHAEWQTPVELLTVGRIEPEKSPAVLVEALKILERRQPGRYRATWVGDGGLREALGRQAEAAGLDDRLELPGYIPFGSRLRQRYRDADLYVHVAVTEGAPGVIWEAMSLGLPIVATAVGGVSAATGDGAAARLVPPGDPEALAEAIDGLDRDIRQRRELCRAGAELARANSLETQSRRVADFLRGAL